MKKLIDKIFNRAQKVDKLAILEDQKHRRFDQYELDIEIHPAESIHIEKELPSEPPEGITYNFGPSGYKGKLSSDYCVVATTWGRLKNYCHWNFSELPFLILAFESGANNIVLPDLIIDTPRAYQKRWLELLKNQHPHKIIYRVSESQFPKNSLFPYNHDTSTNTSPIGKAMYKHYHMSRATPYLIDITEKKYKHLFKKPVNNALPKRFYINRVNRRLKNEDKVQELIKPKGFKVLNLEDLSVDDQIHLFSNAEFVIGFHGAGLSNLLFANSLTKVIEIVDADCVYPSYKDGLIIPGEKATRTYFHMLSKMKNLDYSAVESSNYLLDLDLLDMTLSNILESN